MVLSRLKAGGAGTTTRDGDAAKGGFKRPAQSWWWNKLRYKTTTNNNKQTTTTTTREGDAAERGVSNFQTAGVTTLGLVSALQEANLLLKVELDLATVDCSQYY